MLTPMQSALLRGYGLTVKRIHKEAEGILVGREARICADHGVPVKAIGRIGAITAVHVDVDLGVTALVMVYYAGTKEIMNTDGWTRSYWPLSTLEVL